MPASVHIADVGVAKALRLAFGKAPTADGLIQADIGVCAPFGRGVARPPQFGRVAMFAFWESDGALDAFLASHPTAQALAGGWRVRLEPLRAYGSWPGLPADVTRARHVETPGPYVVLTVAKLRGSQAIRFFRTNAKAEKGVLDMPGNIWATAVAGPPFVATCSLWETEESITAYAFAGNHGSAITENARKGFHRQSAFIRCRPYGAEGSLRGRRNPLSMAALPAGG